MKHIILNGSHQVPPSELMINPVIAYPITTPIGAEVITMPMRNDF